MKPLYSGSFLLTSSRFVKPCQWLCMNTQKSLAYLCYTVCLFRLSNSLKCFSVITRFSAQHNAHRSDIHKFSFSHLPLTATPKLGMIATEIRGNSPQLETAQRVTFGIMVLLWWAPAGHPGLWQMQLLVEVAGHGSGPSRAPNSSRGTDTHASPSLTTAAGGGVDGGQLSSDRPRVQSCWRCREMEMESFSPPSGRWIRIPLKRNFPGCVYGCFFLD